MSKLGLQTQDKNISTLTASGTANGFQAENGRLNFVKDRNFTHDGWLSIPLGKVFFLLIVFFFRFFAIFLSCVCKPSFDMMPLYYTKS